jgi:hypothetical protein
MITSIKRVNVKKDKELCPAPTVQDNKYENMTKAELIVALEEEMITYSKKDTKTKLIKLLLGE